MVVIAGFLPSGRCTVCDRPHQPAYPSGTSTALVRRRKSVNWVLHGLDKIGPRHRMPLSGGTGQFENKARYPALHRLPAFVAPGWSL